MILAFILILVLIPDYDIILFLKQLNSIGVNQHHSLDFRP